MPSRSRSRTAAARSILLHPQQGLWNRDLVGAIRAALSSAPRTGESLVSLLILADTTVLLERVVRRRARLLGARSLRPRLRHQHGPVLHVDCGVHEDGLEIRLLADWLTPHPGIRIVAFEAGRRQFDAARRSLADLANLDLRHQAVVGPRHIAPTVTLYRSSGGYADSIVDAAGGDPEEVDAVRLSQVLTSAYPAHDGPVILRMNVEGAELAVIEDLVDAGLDQRVDGYYGLWDDLSRIDPGLDSEFRDLLAARAISHLTFNGRDLGYRLRRFVIRFDIATSIRHAESRGPRRLIDSHPAPPSHAAPPPR